MIQGRRQGRQVSGVSHKLPRYLAIAPGAESRRDGNRRRDKKRSTEYRSVKINKVPDPTIDDFGDTAEWYLTVRCTNPACARLIAFQKARFPGFSPHPQLTVTGELSADCPHCKTRVRFHRDQIERRNVVLTQ